MNAGALDPGLVNGFVSSDHYIPKIDIRSIVGSLYALSLQYSKHYVKETKLVLLLSAKTKGMYFLLVGSIVLFLEFKYSSLNRPY